MKIMGLLLMGMEISSGTVQAKKMLIEYMDIIYLMVTDINTAIV